MVCIRHKIILVNNVDVDLVQNLEMTIDILIKGDEEESMGKVIEDIYTYIGEVRKKDIVNSKAEVVVGIADVVLFNVRDYTRHNGQNVMSLVIKEVVTP